MGMGGCQGLVGWYMVKSSLEEPKEEGQDIHVSPYRLCMHLTSAFIIYSYVMWLAMSVLRPRPSALASSPARGIKKLAHAAAGVLGITIVSGKATLSSVMLVVHLESTSNSVPHAWSRCFCCRQPRWRVLPRVALDGRLLHTAAHVGYCPRLAQHL